MEKKIRYAMHAGKRLRERRISKEDIEAVLSHPHDELPGGTPDTRRAQLEIRKGEVLNVVFVPGEHEYFVVTAFWKGETDDGTTSHH